MKTKSIPLTESTSPVLSATDTTPMPGGGTCGTGKKQDPTPALMRERKRRKKALAQVRALEDLVKSHREQEERLRAEKEVLQLQLASQIEHSRAQAKRLAFLASCKVKQDGPERLLELNLTIHIDPRQLERGSHGYRLCVAEEVMEALREKMRDTAIYALVKSPLVLLETPAAQQTYQRRKQQWIHGIMMQADMRGLIYQIGPEKLGELWDMIFEAIKDMAMSVPPGTEIQWVDEKPRERPWCKPGKW